MRILLYLARFSISKSEERSQYISLFALHKSVFMTIIYWTCVCTVMKDNHGDQTTSVNKQCLFFIVDVILHTCDCPEMAQIASPAVSKALGLFASAVYMSDFLTALRSPLLGRMRIDLENL